MGSAAAVDAGDRGLGDHAGTVAGVRVVAGTARGRRLATPTGRGTRPTGERVREAIFSMLTSMDAVEGATVADLFAGSGALGIEALSRGATMATFVETDRHAVEMIRVNLEVLGDPAPEVRVVRADAVAFASSMGRHDLVLADPPYAFDGWAALLGALATRAGLLVAETAGGWHPGPAWQAVRVKRYGDTLVTVARPAEVTIAPVHREGER